MAERKEYDTVTSTKLISDKRYEYDGLKLLRVDERCDADGDGEVEAGETSWRTLEAATYGPGIVGNLLGKLVYTHTNGDATPDSQADYYYHYDHVGNVYLVTDDEAEEVYRFAQDAFGNELDFGNYTGDSWATAAAAGIGEHQTGKWIDDFSGLYFFHARWYDSGVGRWVSRDKIGDGACLNCRTNANAGLRLGPSGEMLRYAYSLNNPVTFYDPDGLTSIRPAPGDRVATDEQIDQMEDGLGRCFSWNSIWSWLRGGKKALWPWGDTVPLGPVVPTVGVPGSREAVEEGLEDCKEECNKRFDQLNDIYSIIDHGDVGVY